MYGKPLALLSSRYTGRVPGGYIQKNPNKEKITLANKKFRSYTLCRCTQGLSTVNEQWEKWLYCPPHSREVIRTAGLTLAEAASTIVTI